jgi:hydrogenase maturation protein HypF
MASATTAVPDGRRARRGIRVRGTVQGIGFRPTVYRIASDLALAGLVRNDSDGVWIEIEGAHGELDRFVERLGRDLPPLGKIADLTIVELALAGEREFRVVASEETAAADAPGAAIVPADAAICDECLGELFDRHDRRARYPFINCTACGPRYTIVRDVPYDRVRTTMAAFTLCERCRAEYEDPKDRRFHAEPNACPTCGPRLTFHGAGEEGPDALHAAVADLCAGRIVAVKGLGGFHLACDAEDEAAVARLRERKRRSDKPFAVMVRALSEAETLVELTDATRAALRSPARPIVLAPARPGNGLARSVAPGLGEIGVMLAYTPLHQLLLAEGPPILVMTSGNRSEEPIARENDDARLRLDGIADSFLVHDREIHTRADDSVVRSVAGTAQPVRRSRGFVPEPIALGVSAPPIVAVGAELKNTVCITRGGEAYLSPHVGDLENAETYMFFVEVIEKLGRLLGVAPAIVAHDLHPDYLSTRWALQHGRQREPVQHHHAHVASCLVDNGRQGPVIGVAFDGTGCGPAGDLWGGEVLLCDLVGFTRLAHLRPIALCGGEAAIREPWRLAAAALLDAGMDLAPLARIDERLRGAISTLYERAPRATGAGRWFDAAAALAGVRDVISYEGQAAMELEAVAAAGGTVAHETGSYPFAVDERAGHPDVHDLRPAVRALAADVRRGVGKPLVSVRFHRTMARIVLEAARRGRAEHGVGAVALSGGCFQNRILTELAKELLEADGFEVLVHRRVPPNDGGVALGQAAVAARRWHARQNRSAHVSGNSG